MSFESANLFRSNELEQEDRTYFSTMNKDNIDWNILGDIKQDPSSNWELRNGGHRDSIQLKESLELDIVDENFEITKDEIEIIELVENISLKDFVEYVSDLEVKVLAVDLYRFVRLLSKHLK